MSKHHDPNTRRMFVVDTVKPSTSDLTQTITISDLERIYKAACEKHQKSGRTVTLEVVFDFDDENDHDGMVIIKRDEE